MDKLPLNDAHMLASGINFLLRDNEYENLDEICESFDVPREEVDSVLSSAGYIYSDQLKKVR